MNKRKKYIKIKSFSIYYFFAEVKFHFVFLLPLRNVNKEATLAQLVKVQHSLEDIPTTHIENILNGKTKHKVLIILDGYDEYKRETNKSVDAAIENTVGNCLLLVTSRPGEDDRDEIYISKEVRNKMDGEVKIQGFSDENIRKCSELYLGRKENAEAMLEQVKEKSTKIRGKWTGLYELLRTPITLLMVCVIYNQEESLPETRAQIYELIYNLSMDRTTLKTFKKKSKDIPNIEELLFLLGELAWKALQDDFRQLLLEKVNFHLYHNQTVLK